jgi:hypothetical protein
MGTLPHTMRTRRAKLQWCKRSVGLCSSGSIMADPDDKSMTKRGRNVHDSVTSETYTPFTSKDAEPQKAGDASNMI